MTEALKIRAIVVDGDPLVDDVMPIVLALSPWRVPVEAVVSVEAAFGPQSEPAPAAAPKPSARAERLLAQRVARGHAAARVDGIIDLVAAEFAVERDMIVGAHRSSILTKPRAAIVWLARYSAHLSTTVIAEQMGWNDHTSTLFQSRRAFAFRDEDAAFRATTDELAVIVRRAGQ